jgi:hypothetical protein
VATGGLRQGVLWELDEDRFHENYEGAGSERTAVARAAR